MFQGDKVRVVQTLLFVEGINTLLQTLFGTRLPTVIGGSYAFMVPIVSIIHDPSLTSIPDDHLVSLVFLFFFYSSEYSRKPFTLLLKVHRENAEGSRGPFRQLCVTHSFNWLHYLQGCAVSKFSESKSNQIK